MAIANNSKAVQRKAAESRNVVCTFIDVVIAISLKQQAGLHNSLRNPA
jgi:hypothetical protein